MLTRATIRAFSTEALRVINNVAKQQFIVGLKGSEAVLDYELSGKKITFVHTDVPDVFQGKGVGKLLAKYAFNFAAENKLDVTCKCHFLANFYEKNKTEYRSLKINFDLEE